MTRRFRLICLAGLLLALLSACATAPVQEMSDARQSLRAAEQAGAAELAPEEYKEAVQLLDDANYFISQQRYEVARVVAARAKRVSIAARRAALLKGREVTP